MTFKYLDMWFGRPPSVLIMLPQMCGVNCFQEPLPPSLLVSLGLRVGCPRHKSPVLPLHPHLWKGPLQVDPPWIILFWVGHLSPVRTLIGSAGVTGRRNSMQNTHTHISSTATITLSPPASFSILSPPCFLQLMACRKNERYKQKWVCVCVCVHEERDGIFQMVPSSHVVLSPPALQ